MIAELSNPITALSAILGCLLILFVLLTFLIYSLSRAGHPAADSLRTLRNFGLPLGLVMAVLAYGFNHRPGTFYFKIVETGLYCLLIWVLPSLFKELAFRNPGSKSGEWRARFPELFLDLLRFTLVAVGISLVFSVVWGSDLGGFFATLGVGSIVLGLALQDTLGNLIAGIALLFERPFALGDWVKIGESKGMVREMSWRAVHLFTLEENIVIVPNSVVAKEPILNFSRPVEAHEMELAIGFSYYDPPNKVKKILCEIAAATPGVQPDGILARCVSYGDFAINYEVRFFIASYSAIEEVNEAFMTRVWYVARREGLTIPFPTRTLHKTEIPFVAPPDRQNEITAAISKVDIFRCLQPVEMQTLVLGCTLVNYAAGETVFHQGDSGETLYIVKRGSARVYLDDRNGAGGEIAIIDEGKFFGEMAFLTGEPRSASIVAATDLELVSVHKDSLAPLLRNRRELAESIAEVVSSRRRVTQEFKQQQLESKSLPAPVPVGQKELLKSIYRFFALSPAH
jgi:small-conductance mechanosensitive channel/CRP-like cAMP-binding protein